MEMFSQAMLMYPRLYLQVGSTKRPNLVTQILFPNLCKGNYLPFYKIQVNRFMARDELSGAILNFMTFLSFH